MDRDLDINRNYMIYDPDALDKAYSEFLHNCMLHSIGDKVEFRATTNNREVQPRYINREVQPRYIDPLLHTGSANIDKIVTEWLHKYYCEVYGINMCSAYIEEASPEIDEFLKSFKIKSEVAQ